MHSEVLLEIRRGSRPRAGMCRPRFWPSCVPYRWQTSGGWHHLRKPAIDYRQSGASICRMPGTASSKLTSRPSPCRRPRRERAVRVVEGSAPRAARASRNTPRALAVEWAWAEKDIAGVPSRASVPRFSARQDLSPRVVRPAGQTPPANRQRRARSSLPSATVQRLGARAARRVRQRVRLLGRRGGRR
jgi:hypothetical protein